MWTTRDEINFLSMLGNHSDVHRRAPVGLRRSLLLAYIEAMELRTVWESVDPSLVRDHAFALLETAPAAVAS